MSPISLNTDSKSDHKVTDGAWLWRDEDSMALPLLVQFLSHFGKDALEWTPATIAMEIKDDFGVNCHRVVFDRLMSAIQVLTSNSFFVSLPDFCKICLSFSGEPEGFLPDAGDCAWGITEGMLISPPEEEEPFTEEIRGYIGHALNEEGILNPPDVLRIALRDKGEILAQLNYDYSDDPEMFQAISSFELDRSENINKMVKIRMRKMLEQINKLPLEKDFKANANKIATQLLKKLESM